VQLHFESLGKRGLEVRRIEKEKSEFYKIEKIIKVRVRAEELNSIKARLLENNDRKTLQDD
jgi:hypothetical protein